MWVNGFGHRHLRYSRRSMSEEVGRTRLFSSANVDEGGEVERV